MFKTNEVLQRREYAIGEGAPSWLSGGTRHAQPGVRRQLATVAADVHGRLYLEGQPSARLKVAVSCLVQPLAGDRVCVIEDDGALIVTEILARRQPDAVVTLGSRRAALRIEAPELELRGARRLTLRSPQLTLLTRSGRWIAHTLQHLSRHLFVRAQHAHRQVEHTDRLQAKHVVQEAQQSLLIKSETGALHASAVLKIDGGQIHMG